MSLHKMRLRPILHLRSLPIIYVSGQNLFIIGIIIIIFFFRYCTLKFKPFRWPSGIERLLLDQ